MATPEWAREKALAGLHVLLTRPEHDGEQWRAALEHAGASVAHIPTLAIEPIAVPTDLHQQLRAASIGFFVSGNAVRALDRALSAETETDSVVFKQGIRWFAVGEKTEALAQAHGFGIENVAASDSESLLSDARLQSMDNTHCVIVRGQGGRELLAQVLRSRGATVNYCELYRRDGAWQNQARLASCLSNTGSRPIVVTASSVDALNYSFLLAEKANMKPNLQQLPFLVPGERVADAARALGVRRLIQAQSMRLADIVYELKKWWAEQQ